MPTLSFLNKTRLNTLALTTGLLLLAIFQSCAPEEHEELHIKVKFDEKKFQEKLSGKLIFLFDQDTSSSLAYWVDPFRPQPVFTYDLKGWDPKDTLCLEAFTGEWYRNYTELEGEYAFRMIFDRDSTQRSSLAVKGNIYSKKQKHLFEQGTAQELVLDMDQEFQGWVFQESEFIREERFRSSVLSRFWGYDMFIESAVVLPADYENGERD